MKKILIANRGEIALRIVRAARDYGVSSVAIYADIDSSAPFVKEADEAYSLKSDRPEETYLDGNKIIAIAERSGADAIHPGYGFLSESAEFAKAVIDAGLIWIGPDPEVIDLLGDKLKARAVAKEVGAPLVAGSNGMITSGKDVVAFAEQYGFPVAIKAAHGGGGRGMKVVWKREEAEELFQSAVREAVQAFGRGECYVEQFLDRPRHVEAQVIADKMGHVVVLGTRDCSLQRRNQKLVEEAPAPFISQSVEQRLREAATNICRHVNYSGVGTVEFLLGRNDVVSFLEVNTRLQVEHPVTEETSGLDVVVEQFRIAEGLPLTIDKTPSPIGHAIEFRINAEDVGRGFLPCPGEITKFSPPSGPGVRLDSGVREGDVVAPQFDSMIAKLIITGRTREEALKRASRALKEFTIEGVATVLPFDRLVVHHPDFIGENGFKVYTRWIENDFAEKLAMESRADKIGPQIERFNVEIDGKRVELGLPFRFLKLLEGAGSAVNGAQNPQFDSGKQVKADKGAGDIAAPIPGTIKAWLVENGKKVEEGSTVAVMEAMKMETEIKAEKSGTLEIVKSAGSITNVGEVIARIC
ncbi:acetyl/propionyl/methylcrotonyl-CoA carboxylase subunit alpha [Bartonella apis]|uniref:acetyl/propionyl/methylcrotonyl-CoA carboxylase subunit alpha n=1 Tax=Bartonella apis TaxID=1686310 RepID=UPI0018DB03AA|nr:biotin carboxylase N-terminal domain-containing protein [Bartonella apis]MBI0178462.1 ATP-grasp domain-containing protein [Bartonella apis]